MTDVNESLLDHAWRHFDFHAKQRLSLFNYCIIWAGLIIAAWSQAMTGASPRPFVGVTLGILLVISSVVFWRMDQRNAHLTKMAEGVLGDAESAVFGESVLFNPSRVDPQLRKGMRFLTAKQWSHGQSLKVLFSLMAGAGLLGAAFAWRAQYSNPATSKVPQILCPELKRIVPEPSPPSSPAASSPTVVPR
jgi:hypothetical protein